MHKLINSFNIRNIEHTAVFKSTLRIVLTALALIAFLVYFKNNQEDFTILFDIDPVLLGTAFLGIIIVLLSNVGFFLIIAAAAEKKTNIPESIRVTIYSSIINFFGFLQAGLGYRGIYLKREHGVPYGFYTAITLVQYLLVFGFALFMGTVGFLVLKGSILLALLAFLGFISLLTFAYSVRREILKKIEKSRFKKILSLKLTSRHIGWMFGAALVQFSGLALAFSAELSAVDAKFSFAAVILFTSIAVFSLVFAVTPGAIGIRETMLLIVAGQMSLQVQDVVLSSTIDRLAYFVVLVLLVPVAWLWKDKIRIGKDS